MTVFENVAFGLRVRPKRTRPTEAAIQKKVHDLLNLVQLDWLGDRYPSQLSGGQRQRIALARALAVEPRVLLLDEPFGALDAKVRKDLRRWLRRLHDDLDVTSIFVTHDQEEALEVADRVVLMNGGKVEQVGSPQQVWDNPANPFVYGFLGDVNLFKRRGNEGETHTYIRPHDLDVRRYSTGDTGIVARLERALVVGSVARLELVPNDESTSPEVIEAEIPANEFRDQKYAEGELLVLTPRKSQVFVT
jgi:sulfate transport system ATP-binding protein